MKPYVPFVAALEAAIVAELAQRPGLEHHIVALTPAGAVCDGCRRLLTGREWAAPCPSVPAMLPTDRLSVGPA